MYIYIYIYIYMYIHQLYKNYCFPNKSCRKGKKQATKFHTLGIKQQISGRNYCKFQAETKIKISK